MNRRIVRGIASVCAALGFFAEAASLEEGFRSPPHDAKPQTWWHWMNGNVTKAGITADLEAMAAIGLGGAQIFDAGCEIPPGPVAFNTPAWFEAIGHAAKEARRLGLELCLPNCSGWSSSGGPWNPPENGMKFLEKSEVRTTGPASFNGKLPRPHSPAGFYKDIAVVAYPLPPADKWRMADEGAQVKMTGNEVVISFPHPVEASGFSGRFILPWTWQARGKMKVEVSSDGRIFRPFETREIPLSVSGHSDSSLRFFPFKRPVRARVWRFRLEVDERIKVKVDTLVLEKKMSVSELGAKTFRVRAPVRMEEDVPARADQVVDKSRIVDLTAHMSEDGSLAWEVPPGEWKIVRLGYAANGVRNHPASKFGVGLEVDKLSKSALDFHFDAYIGKLCDYLGPLAGDVRSGLNNILVDSYEVGSQNWTQGFEKEFAKRRGYDMFPYFPVFTGNVVGSLQETERFLADFRRTVADMFAENYSGALAEKCRERGLKLSLEPYGSCPSDNLQYGAAADIPMGEFWSTGGSGVRTVGNARVPGYLAHVWGRRYVATESFTANPGGESGRWQKTPFGIKAQGDRVFTHGVNRIVYHRFVHQPWADGKYLPGMTMGKWGMHFDRTQTWWPLAKDWITYQSRCQFLLQEGRAVADGLFYCGEDAPNCGGDPESASGRPPSLPYGYNWDVCSRDALMRLEVAADGRIVVPGGVAYSFLVLPDEETMSLDALRKIAALLKAGAKIVGRVRPVRTPGLRGYPAADRELAALAKKVWTHPNRLSCTPDEALAKLGIVPDFMWNGKKGRDLNNTDIAFIHRDYGAAGEGYFVAMPNPDPVSLEVSFRQSGRLPELWDAECGTISPAPVWREENGRTFVRLDFRPSGSVFVMFRKPAAGDHAVSLEVAARERPAPLEIVKAEYGSFPSAVTDVTAVVRRAVCGSAVRLQISNALTDGRDPAPMRKKEACIAYRLGGRERTAVIPEWSEFAVSAADAPSASAPAYELGDVRNGIPEIWAFASLSIRIVCASRRRLIVAADVPPPCPVPGPWTVSFPAGWGVRSETVFPRLMSWTDSADDGVKYFSGSAVYTKTVAMAKPGRGKRLILDLGDVKDFAEVTVNGKTYPVLWRPPFCVDITDAIREGGTQDLRIRVTNRWPNRLIGDDRLYAQDCEWKKADFREAIVDIPAWVKEGRKSPTGRHTFTTWKHWNKDDNLLPSGLLGPVLLRTAVRADEAVRSK